MNSIGFKNFRKFTEFPPIKLGGITFLVGGNNAGKSTLVKAMLLIRDFLMTKVVSNSDNIFQSRTPLFKFDTEHVNIGNFQRAFCKTANANEDTLSFQTEIGQFDFSVDIRGERNKMGALPNVSLVTLRDKERDIEVAFAFGTGKMSIRFGSKENKDMASEALAETTYLENRLNDLKQQLGKKDDLKEIAQLNSEIQRLEMRQKELSASSNDSKELIEVPLCCDLEYRDRLLLSALLSGFNRYSSEGTTGNKNSKAYKETVSAKLRLQAHAMEISDMASALDKVLNSDAVQYIYAHSVNQQALYNLRDTGDYATKTIHEFYLAKITEGDEEFAFVQRWLKKFNIGENIDIQQVLGEAYQVSVRQADGTVIEMADLGMGSIQLVILILRLATLMRWHKGDHLTILLEEPEQNLHPALQSDLADMLYDVNQSYGFNFVVETHSEYVVRRSQVIVAKNYNTDDLLKKNPFVTYFMPEHGLPYSMGYKTNGRFEERFGSGFFDEASNANMTLIRMERGIR